MAESDVSYTGEIMITAAMYAPRGWMECNGQMLQINDYGALFSLLGTTYGGDGRSSFALPDLRGCSPVHSGQGRGMSDFIRQGQMLGKEYNQLAVKQLPAHSHSVSGAKTEQTAINGAFTGSGTGSLKVTNDEGNAFKPKGKYLAKAPDNKFFYTADSTNLVDSANDSVAVSVSGETTQTIPQLTIEPHKTEDTGSNIPIPNRPPSLGMVFCICVQGNYPPRP